MKIYIFDKRTNGFIINICIKNDTDIIEVLKQPMNRNRQLHFFNQIDALILEITNPSQDIRFILTHVLLTQKPTLCLYAKKYPPDNLLENLNKQRNSISIEVSAYTIDTLDALVSQFIFNHKLTLGSKLHTTTT